MARGLGRSEMCTLHVVSPPWLTRSSCKRAAVAPETTDGESPAQAASRSDSVWRDMYEIEKPFLALEAPFPAGQVETSNPETPVTSVYI